jgi:hypothetical protein
MTTLRHKGGYGTTKSGQPVPRRRAPTTPFKHSKLTKKQHCLLSPPNGAPLLDPALGEDVEPIPRRHPPAHIQQELLVDAPSPADHREGSR